MALTDLLSGTDAGISVKVALASGEIAADCAEVTPSPTAEPMGADPDSHDPKE